MARRVSLPGTAFRGLMPVSFHDAPIERVWTDDSGVNLAIGAFAWSPDHEDCPPTLIRLIGATRITRCGEVVGAVVAEHEFGEVNALDEDGGGVTLCVFWTCLRPRGSVFVDYRLTHARTEVTLRLDRAGPAG